MYAQIYSRSLDNLNSGKTVKVFSDISGLKLSSSQLKSISIRTKYIHNENSGDRGGNYNPITREFHLELEKGEVEKLFDFAVKEGVIDIYKDEKITELYNRIKELDDENKTLMQYLKIAQFENDLMMSKLNNIKDIILD